jgi:hypothetical protein
MAAENAIWGEERIANERRPLNGRVLFLRTTAESGTPGDPRPAVDRSAIVACDFFVVVTANFRILYVFVIMELGSIPGRRKSSHLIEPSRFGVNWLRSTKRVRDPWRASSPR